MVMKVFTMTVTIMDNSYDRYDQYLLIIAVMIMIAIAGLLLRLT